MSQSNQHRIFRPDNLLNIKARRSDMSVAEMMAKSHQVMADIAKDYPQWLRSDLKALVTANKKLRAEPHNGAGKPDLFRIAHDIRGQAPGFGYALAGDISASLCQYLERTERFEAAELHIVGAHIKAIRACVLQSLKGDGGATGQELMAELTALIQRNARPKTASSKRQ